MKNFVYLCIRKQAKKPFAQMAESVDALVSNTSGFTSIPVRPRVWVPKEKFNRASLFCLKDPYIYTKYHTLQKEFTDKQYCQYIS